MLTPTFYTEKEFTLADYKVDFANTSYKTSFLASKRQLIDILDDPTYCNVGLDCKVQNEWNCAIGYDKIENGVHITNAEMKPICVYDWKEYDEITDYDVIEWHIGAIDSESAEFAKKYIQQMLLCNTNWM